MSILPSSPSLLAKVFNRTNIATAFVTSASRMVGASYRVYDAYDPKLREGAISPQPEVVIKREGISLALAWMFGLFTAAVNSNVSRKLGLKDKSLLVSFFTIVIANALAEGVSRLISYQGVSSKKTSTPTQYPPKGQSAPFSALPSLASNRAVFP